MGNDYSVKIDSTQALELTEKFQNTNGAKFKVVLIDDDEMCLRVAKHKIESLYKNGVEVQTYNKFEDFEKSGVRADVVVLDYMYEQQFGHTNGLSLLVKLKMLKPAPEVYMLTGHSHMNIAVQAMKSGAADYIVKGEGCYERLNQNIAVVIRKRSVLERRTSLLSLFSKRMGF